MATYVSRWLALAVLVALVGLASAAPLTFEAALESAERQAPLMAASAAQIDAARSAAIPANALPDPKLVAGVDNYPVSGAARWGLNNDPMTMQRIGVMQEIPNAAKRHAREDVALAGVDVVQMERAVVRLQVRRDAAIAWLARYFVEQRITLFDDLQRENDVLDAVVKAQIAGGRGQAADAVMARQEAAQLADRRDDLVRDLAKARAGLRRLLGPTADERLAGGPPLLEVDAGRLQRHVHTHPEIQTFDALERKAAAEVREAKSAKKSDWGVELAFQRRSPQFGNMVSVQFTYDLPFFSERRQDPLILAKERERDRIDAEREAMLRDHSNELDNDLADLAALSSRIERTRQITILLAQEKVDLQGAAYRSGKVDLNALLAARRELIDVRLKLIELEGEKSAVAAKLKYSYEEIVP